MTNSSDEHIIEIMTGEGDDFNRLRQSVPYVGLVDEETKLKLVARHQKAQAANEEAEDVEHGHDRLERSGLS